MGKTGKIIILLLLTALACAGFFYFKAENKTPSDILRLYGNIDIRQTDLAFHDIGRIKRLYVEEGSRVKAGELVGEIDASRYEAEAHRIESELETQKWIVEKLHRGSRPQEIEAAKAVVAADEARLKNAEITYHRMQKLAKTQYVPKQKLDDATALLKGAKAQLRADKQALDLTIIGPRKEDIAAAKAKLKAITAALDLARERLSDTRLYSPSDGIIRDRIMEPGDMAFPQAPVFTLALDDPMWVRTYVPEPDIGKIKEGMKAEISTDSFPGKKYFGWVGFISPAAEFTPKNVETPELRTRLVYQVRVFICQSYGELRLGMPVTVNIPLNQPIPDSNASKGNPCPDIKQ